MSGYPPPVNPAIPVFGWASFQDNDTYYLDCRDNMDRRGDYIDVATLVSVTRADRRSIVSGDFAATDVGVVPEGTLVPPLGILAPLGKIISWQGAGGLASVTYLVTINLALHSGNEINRTTEVQTPQFVG